MSLWWHYDRNQRPRLSASAVITPGGGHEPDRLELEIDLRSGWESIAAVGVTLDWNRPRPWKLDVTVPSSHRLDRVLVWRDPEKHI